MIRRPPLPAWQQLERRGVKQYVYAVVSVNKHQASLQKLGLLRAHHSSVCESVHVYNKKTEGGRFFPFLLPLHHSYLCVDTLDEGLLHSGHHEKERKKREHDLVVFPSSF